MFLSIYSYYFVVRICNQLTNVHKCKYNDLKGLQYDAWDTSKHINIL